MILLLNWLLWLQTSPNVAEPRFVYELLDNANFAEEISTEVDLNGRIRVPWWRTSAGAKQLNEHPRGLSTQAGLVASQPLGLYAQLAETLQITGRIHGRGTVQISAGDGSVARFGVGGDAGPEFTLTGREIAAELGGAIQPRLVLQIESNEPAVWLAVQATAELPLPSEAVLQREITAVLERTFENWLERGLDREGPVHTELLCQIHDVVTGERIRVINAAFNHFWPLFLDAWRLTQREDWGAVLSVYVERYLQYGLDPETGLPRNWDVVRDEPIHQYVDIASSLEFLIDVAEGGPAEVRAPSRAAALRIAEAVLLLGTQPDGAIASRYRANDGDADPISPPLRRLDVALQLGRIGELTGDSRYFDVVRRAFARLEFTHTWQGERFSLDPGFDDFFGYLVGRAEALTRCDPEGPYDPFVREGVAWFYPRWRDAVRLGAPVAADQVRCWRIFAQRSHDHPGELPALPAALRAAYRSRFKSQQDASGAWGDMTHSDFDPRPHLQVGDRVAVPGTLLEGLAIAYDPRFGLDQAEIRALYAAILRTTMATQARPHGLLSTRNERASRNLAGGSVHLGTGLVAMLEQLR